MTQFLFTLHWPSIYVEPLLCQFYASEEKADSDPEEMGGSGSRINGQIGIRIQNKWADRDPDPEEMGGFGSRRVGRIRIQKRWAHSDPEEMGRSGSRRDGRIRIQRVRKPAEKGTWGERPPVIVEAE